MTITDTNSATLLPGWAGYGDEDALANPIVPPGVTLADVLAGVDEIAFTTLQPGFFFGFTDFDIVLDNIAITYPDVERWTDLGGGTVGANDPDTLAGTGTFVGGTPAGLDSTGAPANALVLGWVSLVRLGTSRPGRRLLVTQRIGISKPPHVAHLPPGAAPFGPPDSPPQRSPRRLRVPGRGVCVRAQGGNPQV